MNNCHNCGYKVTNPGTHHVGCQFDWINMNHLDRINDLPEADDHPKRHGWWEWPIIFDPIWMLSPCKQWVPKGEGKEFCHPVQTLVKMTALINAIKKYHDTKGHNQVLQ